MHLQGRLWQPLNLNFRLAGRLQIFVCIDIDHGIQLDEVPELWLLQDWMGTSARRVNPVALDLPVACQVSVPSNGAHPFWLGFSLVLISGSALQ